MEDRTNQPFTEALGNMLRERSGDRMGRFPLEYGTHIAERWRRYRDAGGDDK